MDSKAANLLCQVGETKITFFVIFERSLVKRETSFFQMVNGSGNRVGSDSDMTVCATSRFLHKFDTGTCKIRDRSACDALGKQGGKFGSI